MTSTTQTTPSERVRALALLGPDGWRAVVMRGNETVWRSDAARKTMPAALGEALLHIRMGGAR